MTPSRLAWLEVYQLYWSFQSISTYFHWFPLSCSCFQCYWNSTIFIVSFLLIALIFNFSYFSCFLRYMISILILDRFSLLIYAFNNNFMCKHCFTCILQLLMLCFHLVQFIIIFYYLSIIVYNVVFISGTLVKIIFNFSWEIIWYLFHLLNWLKYWSNVFNFKISGSILFIFLLSSSHLILIYSEDFVWFIFSKIC